MQNILGRLSLDVLTSAFAPFSFQFQGRPSWEYQKGNAHLMCTPCVVPLTVQRYLF